MRDLTQSVPELTLAYKEIEDTGRRSEQQMSQGWALRRVKPHQTFNPNQVTFLQNLFNEGEQTGRKHTAKDASVAMRNARNADGGLRFTAAEYLTETQIRALFSRWNGKGNQQRSKRSTDSENSETDSDNEEFLTDLYVDVDEFEDNFPDADHELSPYDIIMSVVEEIGPELANTC